MNPLLGVLFNCLGFVVGAIVYFSEAKRLKLNNSRMREVALIGVVVGLVAATAAQWIYAWLGHGPENMMSNGGKTIIGGVLGGWAAVEFAKRRLGIKETTGPLWALALPAGEVFGRVGCWFHGCCSGRVCDLPWAVYQHGEWRHPTQFLLSGAALVSFVVLWRFRDKVDVFSLGLLLWAVSRIFIEPLRDSSTTHPWLVPGICFLVAVYAGVRLWRGKVAVVAEKSKGLET